MDDFLRRNKTRADKYHKRFKEIFGTSLMNYYSFLFGFDVVKFDEEFIKPKEGQSTSEVVEKKYGKEAVELCRNLMG